ncbi:MAG: amidohydrolase family protein [Planctomycetes bacterium]|nr:amidohydrolase family protein [Planctomycetota bacterium]
MEAKGLMDAGKTRSHMWRVPARGRRSRLVDFSCVLFALVSFDAARAQLFERALVLQGARLVTMAGEPIEEGTVIVKGGRIMQIGSKVDAPFLSKKINVTGRTITPGFIDAWSALGRLPGSPSADPTSLAWDAFDRYAKDAFQDAFRHGVTSLYFGAAGASGITGVGVVLRLVPGDGGAIGEVVSNDAALCINLDSGARVVSRLKTFRSVRKQFKDALDYRQSLEDYQEELKEYLEKLEERRKEKSEGDKKEDSEDGDSEEDSDKDDDKDDGESTPDDEPSPSPPEPEPPEDAVDKSTTSVSVAASRDVSSLDADEDDEEKENGDDEDGEKKEGEDEEELEKPTEPSPDRKSDVLLRAIDHEMPVRITAHRSADILNALALADEFNLDIIIEGATEARFVADQLAEARVPVVLGPTLRTGSYVDNEFRRHARNTGDALSEAGVQWTVTSGGQSPAAARFVGITAQLAAAHNRKTSDWLRLVTTDAAKILGLSNRSGRLVRGGQADFVVWSGDPSDPSSKVEQVYVAGQLAYEAQRTSTPPGGGR